MTDRFTLPRGKTIFQMPKLTAELLAELLDAEPKAEIRRDDDMRPVGVDLPLPDGITYGDGTRAISVSLGDRVGRDERGNWLVVRTP